MKPDIVIRADAEDDVAEAFEYYQSQRPGLGYDFLLAFEVALEQIRDRPGSFPVVHRDVRRALLKRFPYGVYFFEDAGRLIVFAVFHGARSRKGWQKRR